MEQLPDDLQAFAQSQDWVVSECIVFPGKRVNGRNTINGERGMSRKIGDRFDLTLECIRRHYIGEASPLTDVFERYSTFFSLFENFNGYVDFFLLQDLVSDDCDAIRFYLPSDDFGDNPLPQGLDSYEFYLRGVESFAKRRAERMLTWCRENARSTDLA